MNEGKRFLNGKYKYLLHSIQNSFKNSPLVHTCNVQLELGLGFILLPYGVGLKPGCTEFTISQPICQKVTNQSWPGAVDPNVPIARCILYSLFGSGSWHTNYSRQFRFQSPLPQNYVFKYFASMPIQFISIQIRLKVTKSYYKSFLHRATSPVSIHENYLRTLSLLS